MTTAATSLDWGQHIRQLYYEIVSRLDHRSGALVQFIGASGGCGVSSVARMVALAAASLGGGPVFLMDLAGVHNGQHAWFRDRSGLPLRPMEDGVLPPHGLWVREVEDAVHLTGHWVGGLKLGISECRDLDPPPGFDLRGQPQFWETLRQRFELVVVDAPASSGMFDGILLSRHMDGVVLVVEAEETRTPVAAHLRDELVDAGASIVGVVLNKRRFHIPQFFYRWL